MMIPRRDEDMTTATIRLERAKNLGGFFGVLKYIILAGISGVLTKLNMAEAIGPNRLNIQESGRLNL